jgi:hypothetical protein
LAAIRTAVTIKRIAEYFYRSIPTAFASDFPAPEAVSRLRNATRRSVLAAFLTECAVGPVSQERVRLQRLIPFVGNSFKPIFVGSFVERNGRTMLDGRFTLFRFTKIFMTFWFTFILLWTTLASAAVIFDVGLVREQPQMLLLPVGGVALFLVGLGFLRFGWWISRRDVDFLSAVISGALAREVSSNP